MINCQGFLVVYTFFLMQHAHAAATSKWDVYDILRDDTNKPLPIGHRGYGENLGENPDIPIENTKEAVRKALQDGIAVVEVDVVLSKDGKAVVNHDDYYSQTCLHDRDYGEIQELLPHPVALLEHILQVASVHAKNSDTASGLVVVEIKNSSPLCDPEDEQGPILVQAVVDAIKKAGMEDQVLIHSFGPDLLMLAQELAPEIPRSLILNALQLLTQEQVEAITGLPVIAIDKEVGLGLTWTETGPFFRLPAYVSGVQEFLRVASVLGVVCVNLDKLFLLNLDQPESFVQLLQQGYGWCVHSYTAVDDMDWNMLAALGVDGIITNDIAAHV